MDDAPKTNLNPNAEAEFGQVPVAKLPSRRRRYIFLAAALLVIAAVLLVVYFGRSHYKNPENKTGVISNRLPDGYHTMAPPRGQYPLGFPSGVVVSKGAVNLLRAEQTVAATGQHYDVVDVAVGETPTEVAAAYKDALPKQGWQLTNSLQQSGLQSLQFQNSSGQLTVTITPKGSGSQVNLAYVY